jgi:hypothetical protein
MSLPETEAVAAGPLLESGAGGRAAVADDESARPSAKQSLLRRFGPAALYPVVAVALFLMFLRISDTFPMISDGANNALQGWDLLHGHLLLHNWIIGDATYYTLELPLFALTESVTGLTAATTHVVAALTLLVVIIAAAAVARGEARGAHAVMRYIVVVAVIAVPLRDAGATSVMDSNPEHFGTGAILLAAFLIVERWPARWFTAILLAAVLDAGELGDATVLYVGAIPIVAVGAYRILAARSLRTPATAIVLAAAASYPLELLTRKVMRHFGGYTMVPPHTNLAPMSQWLGHAHIVYLDVLVDFGIGHGSHTFTFTWVVGFVLCLFVLLGGLAGLLRVLVRWRSASWAEQLVCAAIVFNLGEFVVSSTTSQDNAREVIFVVAGSAVLAARLVSPAFAARRVVMGGLAVAAVVPLVFGVLRPPAVTSTPDLAQWLEAHQLYYGIGPYADAASVSLQSGGKVQVRAVVGSGGDFFAYAWETRADWYHPSTYDAVFFIAYPDDPGDRITPTDVQRVYGAPKATYQVVGRTIMVYDVNLLNHVIPAAKARG